MKAFASRLGLRLPLVWLLAASALLSAIALLWPGAPTVVVAVDREPRQPQTPVVPEPAATRVALPARLSTIELAAAQSDPFVAPVPPAPPAAAAPKSFVGPLYQPAAPPPPPQYRFVGRLTDPAGRVRYLLGRADRDVLVEPGTVLDDGYVVQELTPEVITLRHASGLVVPINVPAAGDETRP